MKNLIVAGLSALSIGAIVSPTMASEVIAMKRRKYRVRATKCNLQVKPLSDNCFSF